MKKRSKKLPNKIFAERFRTLMAKRGAVIADISRLTGCAVSTASTWRRGTLPRHSATIEKIAKFLGVDAQYLAGAGAVFSNENRSSKGGARREKAALKKKFSAALEKASAARGGLERLGRVLDEFSAEL
ncbi:MAG: helix-turn-helix transcriptional regulator [Opitutales bacterium]|nr:helix-turn-helix transcriptional regulator [Opitutales bacterium]